MSTLKTPIESWCRTHAVTVPPGFHRRSASRYVAVDTSQTPFKLVARTWFDLKDLEYYLENVGTGDSSERWICRKGANWFAPGQAV